MNTLDFELEIGTRIGDTYPVVARSPGGDVATSLRLPLTFAELDRELSMIRNAVLASSAVIRRTVTEDERPVQELGRQLFEAVMVDDVRSLYVASGQRAREHGSALRLVLRVRPPELARLPWEFLFDPGQQDYIGLTVPLIRYPDVLAPRQPLTVAAPLRILAMVARPGDQHALDIDGEQQRLRAALTGLQRDGLVELEWVAGQTYNDLEDVLDCGPWHVFHFVGHGGYDRDLDEGTLALADAHGLTDLVGADDLSRLLADHHTLRLVVLNACDTGRSSALDVFSSTAGALVRRGIPAVVAMQFEITDPAAIQFAQTFYQNVAKRLPVDTSVTRARRALRRAKKDTLEWGTPVLYLRVSDGLIFDTTASSRPSPPQDPMAAPEVEVIYDQAVAAFWTQRWDDAVTLLGQVLEHRPDHADAAVKLEQASRQQQLANCYKRACQAADVQDWEQAVVGFTTVAELDPTYQDVRNHLANARSSARRADQLASRYRSGLRLLDAGEWQQAAETLKQVAEMDPAYRDTAALLDRARGELAKMTRLSPPKLLPRPLARYPKSVQSLHHRTAVYAVVFSPDGHWLATGSENKNARIWNITSGQELLKMNHKGWSASVKGVAFSPDGRWLATAGSDGTARIWDTTTGDELVKLVHDQAVFTVAFGSDELQLATGSADGTVRIWDTANGQELAKAAQNDVIWGVVFSPNGRRLATAGGNGTAQIWELATGQKRTFNHESAVLGVAFSPDGRRLATASSDGTVRIWDTTNGQELIRAAQDDVIWRVAFNSDGRRLATAGADGTARIWDTTNGQELSRVTHKDGVQGVAFSPDERWLATASDDKTVQVWALDDASDDKRSRL